MILLPLSQYNIPFVLAMPLPSAWLRADICPLNNNYIEVAITNMLTKEIIIPSTNDWVSEPHLIKKDIGTFHCCINFRPLNKVTIHDVCPVLNMDNLLHQPYPLPNMDKLFIVIGKINSIYYFT